MLDKTTRQKVGGVVYCGAWYASILTGFYYLYAPLLPLLLVHRGLYRRLTDILFAAWESFNVSLLEIVFGMQTYVGGDYIRPEENSLIIVNHRTRVDWNFLWSALLHGTSPPAHNAKLVLKDELKRVPGIGKKKLIMFMWISFKQQYQSFRKSLLL
jgi:lysocardiolipin and lysophospholipid acyltransferase